MTAFQCWIGWQGGLVGAPRLAFHDGTIDAPDAVCNGWSALRTVFRMWSIYEREDLTGWLRRRGFPGTQPGNHISARAQEHILTEACRTDARVALLEASHVAVVLHVGRQMAVPSAIQGDAEQRFRQAGRQDTRTNPFDGAWAQLDSVDCHDLTKIPMLKSCPRFFRGKVARVSVFRIEREVQRQDGGRCTGRNTWLEVVRSDPHDVASQAAWDQGGWQGGARSPSGRVQSRQVDRPDLPSPTFSLRGSSPRQMRMTWSCVAMQPWPRSRQVKCLGPATS